MQVQLKVVGGKQSGQLISINRPKFMIGRADDCQLKSRNELISRYHCVLLTEEGYVGVRDLGSRNGVFVNGEKIDQETELRNGDRLTIGPLEFEVVVSVAMSAGKKPKVESIADVVARTVEQNSLSAAGKEEDHLSSWILEDDSADWKVVTEAQPTEKQREDMAFAWDVCRMVKSNAITVAKDNMLLGAGAGQMNRVGSVEIAIATAGDRINGAVLASDAFFPFPDSVERIHTAGIQAIIQPGGSIRDQEVIDACNKYGIAMIFTGKRHFRH